MNEENKNIEKVQAEGNINEQVISPVSPLCKELAKDL
jgi:hypothetical protein